MAMLPLIITILASFSVVFEFYIVSKFGCISKIPLSYLCKCVLFTTITLLCIYQDWIVPACMLGFLDILCNINIYNGLKDQREQSLQKRIFTASCTREQYHDGPCNGLPSKNCPGYDNFIKNRIKYN